MTDAELQKLAAVAAPFGNCNEAGLLQLFKVVRDDTARACAEECDKEEQLASERGHVSEASAARWCGKAIRRLFISGGGFVIWNTRDNCRVIGNFGTRAAAQGYLLEHYYDYPHYQVTSRPPSTGGEGDYG